MESNNQRYKVTFRKRAAQEYIEAIAWYKKRSLLAAENFIKEMNMALTRIKTDPQQFRNSYKHFHELKLRRYPFTLVYFIDAEKSLVVVATLFHHKRDPNRKFI